MRNPVVRIEIENILGIERLDVTPGALTIVEGGNGRGKTSFLEAIRSVATEGHDPSLLRSGATRGLVRITLEDGSTLLKKITSDGSSFEGRHPRVGKVSKARAWVDSLIDELGADPLALVNCPASKRAEYLADVMAVEVSDEDLTLAAGRSVADLKIPARLEGLDRIEAVRKALYDERTGVNRLLKEKKATAAQLRETLPPAAEAPGDLAELRARRRDLAERKLQAERTGAAEREAAEREASRAREAAVSGIAENARTESDAIREDAAEKIRELERLRDEAVSRVKERQEKLAGEARDQERTALAAAEAKQRAALTILGVTVGQELADLDQTIARAEERANEHARAQRTREILEAAERDAERLEDDASKLNESLEALAALKTGLLAQVPVRGLEIREGAVLVDGVPFDRVNTARQIEVALEVAALRAKDVPLLVSDHGEALDGENWAALEAKAAAMGFNVIVARRTDGPLTVRTVPPAEKAA